jgi:hypothetical protein
MWQHKFGDHYLKSTVYRYNFTHNRVIELYKTWEKFIPVFEKSPSPVVHQKLVLFIDIEKFINILTVPL